VSRHLRFVVLVAALVAGCNNGSQGEFEGDGWFQGQVFVCNQPGQCRPLRYPTPSRNPVYVELRELGGSDHGSYGVENDGTFGWFAAPGTYVATLKPRRLYGLRVRSVRFELAADGQSKFDLAYGALQAGQAGA
jgi:hypothetical protein